MELLSLSRKSKGGARQINLFFFFNYVALDHLVIIIMTGQTN